MLPSNAIVVEIAPHGLLQAIVRKSMPGAVHVPLTQRPRQPLESADGVKFLLAALGKLFLHGITMPVELLYPAVRYPVSRGTDKIAPLMRWDHAESYFVTKFEVAKEPESVEMRETVNLGDSEYAYVAGHTIDGRCLFPATGYLELVWMMFARQRGAVHHVLNVEFEDVQFMRATALQASGNGLLCVLRGQSDSGREIGADSLWQRRRRIGGHSCGAGLRIGGVYDRVHSAEETLSAGFVSSAEG